MPLSVLLHSTRPENLGEVVKAYSTGDAEQVNNQDMEDVMVYVLYSDDPVFARAERELLVIDDELVERPKLFDQDVYHLPPDGTEIASAPAPVGTVILFSGETDEIIVEEEEPIIYSTYVPGNKYLTVRPPFPLQTQDIEIISNA